MKDKGPLENEDGKFTTRVRGAECRNLAFCSSGVSLTTDGLCKQSVPLPTGEN